MMRSLFSGVAGLRTHQTRMDVIGNNIANVNTVAFKGSTVNFQDMLYQTTQNASGANQASGRAGINAKQIGLGVSTASISTNIATSGSAQSTGSPFDIRITGDSFFVVTNGNDQFYTRAGAFNVDAKGTLCMSSNGYPVLGYAPMKNEAGETVINKSALSTLDIMSEKNMVSDPVATTKAYMSGILDKNSESFTTDLGEVVTVPFYDNLGYAYTAQYAIKRNIVPPASTPEGSVDSGQYTLELTDILNSSGKSIFTYQADTGGSKTYNGQAITTPDGYSLGDEMKATDKKAILGKADVLSVGGTADTDNQIFLTFDTFMTDPSSSPKGTLMTVTSAAQNAAQTKQTPTKENGKDTVGFTLNLNKLSDFSTGFAGMVGTGGSEKGVAIDLSTLQNVDNKGNSSISSDRGSIGSDAGAGCRVGELSSISIANDGRITGAYTNGQTKLLGQIAAASFANPSGLEKAGDNLYAASMNSGEPNVNDITVDGGSMTSGELEMSNVDLSAEFTSMITTQRGFQANSRIITVSDTLLEELINLKR